MASGFNEEDHRYRVLGCSNSGGYELSRFEENIDEEFICAVCKDVYDNPRLTPCRHIFCFYCIHRAGANVNDEEQQAMQSNDHLRCPICKEEFNSSELRDVPFPFKNLLDKKPLKCSFKDCGQIEKLENIGFHEFRCSQNPERETTCPDCDEKLRHSVLKEDHMCEKAVLRKFKDLEKIKHEINQELDQGNEILKEMLK